MKLLVLLLLICLALGGQGRVLQAPKEAIDIPVEIIQEKAPQALPLVAAEKEKEKEVEKEIEAVKELEKEVEKELETEAKTQLPLDPVPEIKAEEPKVDIPAEIKTELPKIAEEQPTEAQTEQQIILKALPAEENPAPDAPAPDAPAAAVAVEEQDAVQPNLRQATQATPTQQQPTTQQNFVQQLIQNSPIGQFLNQFNANNQQQQQQPLADQPATPAPTLPGFLNPSNAITTVQNAAQSVVNGTTQAFQGIQQFASNLGTQFQNTLSGLTGQQQQQQSTTPRPPGPIQSFVNNVFGGGNNATAAAPPQQQGPLQGIINFLGGNRPQTAAPAAVTEAPAKPAVDDKIESSDDLAEQPADAENEVRNSAEAVDDSFEEAVPANEVIVVNDDASSNSDVAAPELVETVPNNSVEPQPTPVAL